MIERGAFFRQAQVPLLLLSFCNSREDNMMTGGVVSSDMAVTPSRSM
jgi:hypothetical protein